MADFRLASSQLHLTYIAAEETFALDPGSTGDFALFGGGPNGEQLTVRAGADGVAQIVYTAPHISGSTLRTVRVKGVRIGATTLTAHMPDGAAWASADLVVGFTPGSMSQAANVPMLGEIPFAIGVASWARIPVPFTNGLCVELGGRGWSPKTGSTSTLFIQNATGKQHLRLDYGYNVQTQSINYHWNQKGTYKTFGIVDHALVGVAGRNVYTAARYFRYAGRALAVIGVAADAYSVVVADKPLRQAAKVVSGWAGAWVGCKVVGAGGAWVGTAVEPGLGTAVGGSVGCLAGAFIGYEGFSRAAGRLYDWGDARFTRIPDSPAP
ncbi:MAG: hypothetical protein ABIQ16_07855 [Polyangiaceae bacterium]